MTTRQVMVWAALALAGCGGGSAGSPDAGSIDGGPIGNGGVVKLATLDDPCDGQSALTGRSILDLLLSSYAATYTAQGATTGTALTITTTYQAGDILCHPHFSSCAQCGAPDMIAYIELEVATTFSTADGTFAESFTARVRSPGGLSLQGYVAIDQLHGSFHPAIAGSWDTHQVSFGGDLGSTGATQGSVVEQVSRSNMGQTLGAGAWK
jgi:hypothetical protein